MCSSILCWHSPICWRPFIDSSLLAVVHVGARNYSLQSYCWTINYKYTAKFHINHSKSIDQLFLLLVIPCHPGCNHGPPRLPTVPPSEHGCSRLRLEATQDGGTCAWGQVSPRRRFSFRILPPKSASRQIRVGKSPAVVMLTCWVGKSRVIYSAESNTRHFGFTTGKVRNHLSVIEALGPSKNACYTLFQSVQFFVLSWSHQAIRLQFGWTAAIGGEQCWCR